MSSSKGSIAIVSMACRLPAADTPAGFWANLRGGVRSFEPPPPDRDWRLVGPEARAAFLDRPYDFDAALFGWSDEDAAFADPQQRLLLESSYEALERAGLAGPRRRDRSIGVYVGVGHTDYLETVFRRLWAGADLPASTAVGNLRNLVAARVAHQLDLRGPAMVVDTACSSSLVAIHQARESLLRGECDAAIAGGVTLQLTGTAHHMLAKAGAISRSGSLRPFARDGDGIVLGEGCGVLVLEPLERALERDAPVLASLEGSAINNDGRSVHPMAPRPGGQRAVIEAAWRSAGLDPKDAGYVEAHGTGTRVGDAVETRSIIDTFGPRDGESGLAIGSVKGNIGHLLSGAGMPSVMKVVLSLVHRELPPTLPVDAASNAELGLERAGVAVPREVRPWTERLLAGVNGFGFGGTNAHLIVGAPPERSAPPAPAPGPPRWALTAATESALRQSAADLAAWLRTHDADPARVAHDVSLARDPMKHRLAIVGATGGAEVAALLERFANAGAADGVRVGVGAPEPAGTGDDPLEAWLQNGAPLPAGDGSMNPDLELPTYPFEHRVHRASAPELAPPSPALPGGTALDHPLLTGLVRLHLDHAVYTARVDGDDVLVAQHSVHGVRLLPGAGCVEILRAAAEHALGAPPAALSDVSFLSPVFPGMPLEVHVARKGAEIRASIRDEAGRTLARARVDREGNTPAFADRSEVLDRAGSPAALYEALSERGMIHGPAFQAVRSLELGPRSARADLELPDEATAGAFGVHPALLDAAMQPVATILLDHAGEQAGLWVPLHVETVHLALPPEGLGARAITEVHFDGDPSAPGDTIRCDVTIRDREGAVRVALAGLRLHRVEADAPTLRAGVTVSPFHRLEWVLTEPPERSLQGQRWAVVPLEHPSSAAVTDGLRNAGARVERWRLTDVSPALARDPRVTGVVFVGAAAEPAGTLEELDRATRRGVHGFTALGRAIAGAPEERRPERVIAVTAGATTGAAPEQATTAAACFSLPEELPPIESVTIDAPAVDDDALAEAAVLGATLAPGWYRHRDGELERRGVVELDLGAESVPIARGGVHLITGGGSGIGYAIAERLAEPGRTLVLVGRRRLVDHRSLEARVAALRERGARVDYVSCDVADEDAVRGLMARLTLELGALDGVVHAAGVVAPGRLHHRGDDALERVLAPKVRGSWLLWRELKRRGLEPSYVALFSSASAAFEGLGGGLGDYVAANAFLDAFASGLRAAGEPVVSIGWSAWSETGMGAHPALLESLADRGLLGIRTAEGTRAFEAAVGSGLAHVIVAPTTDGAPAARSAPRTPRAAPAIGRSDASPVGDRRLVAAELRRLVAGPLEIDPSEVPEEQSFLSMGLDSLVALELVQVLEQRMERELPPTLFFDHPTIAELAEHLAELGYGGSNEPVDEAPDGEVALPPLSKTQRAFWIQERLLPEVKPFSYLRQSVEAPLDLDRLARAARHVTERHPMLRAQLIARGGEPALEPREPRTPVPTDHGLVDDLDAWADAVCAAPGDPSSPPAWRLDHACTADGRSHLSICAHHLVADAWSLHLLATELWEAYARDGALETAAVVPADAGVDVDADVLASDLKWWRDALETVAPPPLSRLRADEAEAPSDRPIGAHTLRLSREATATFTGRASALSVSPFHLSLALYARQLARETGVERVTINVARARRDLRKAGAAGAVGSFADTLPLTLQVGPDPSIDALANQAREAMAALEAHGTPTSADLASLLPPGADGLRTASPASYSFARFPLRLPEGAPRIVESAGRTASAATRLSLAAWEHEGALCFTLDHAHEVLGEQDARAFLERLVAAHATVGEGASAPLIERLVSALRADPERVALVDEGEPLTAGALDRASGALAAGLIDEGVRPGDLVGLIADQGREAVIAILGVLRAGAGWVPLDPSDPPLRLRDHLARAAPRAVLRASDVPDAELGVATRAIADLASRAVDEHPIVAAEPGATAYVIFTSGSTGRPKGVPIPHAAMAGYLRWALETFGYGPTDVTLGTSSPCFDASVRQLLAPLLTGARLVTCARRVARDPETLLAVLEAEGVTILSTVPTLLGRLVATLEHAEGRPLSALRLIQCGGEALPPRLIRALHDRLESPPAIANLYGPTEATINATFHVVDERPDDDESHVPIGRAAAGAVLEVVDGELWVGGPGLSPGYLDDPAADRRAFAESAQGRRMYRTGDRVRRRPDGVLEFVGRVDEQLKIQGHRIEPGEVEAALRLHAGVAAAAVRAIGEGDERRLHAWVEPAGEPPTEGELRAHLERRMPRAMIPRCFHVRERLPLTPTGKIDRQRLVPDGESEADGEPVSGDTAERVARVFARVLGRPAVALDDDFFALGGDSMGVLDVFARLEESFDPLPRAVILYRTRTARALAAAIERASDVDESESSTAGDEEWFDLSATQRGFLAARIQGDDHRATRWRAVLRLDGPLHLDGFRRALELMVARHPMLRTIIDIHRRPPKQKVLADAPLAFEYVADGDEVRLRERVEELCRAELDPAKAPPIALALYRMGPERHALVVVADHLLGDALSASILLRELVTAHDAFANSEEPALPPLKTTFRAFVDTSARRSLDPASRAYWRRVFEDPYELGTAWHRPSRTGPTRTSTLLSAREVTRLREAALERGMTLPALLFGAWAHVLSGVTRRSDLIVGCAVAGRDGPPAGLSTVFGPFATALPVRVDAGSSAERTIETAQAALADARTHELSPGEIVSALERPLDPALVSGARLFFTFMDFEGLGPEQAEGPSTGLQLDEARSVTEGELVGQVDLQLGARPVDGGLRLVLQGGGHAMDDAGLAALREQLRASLDELADASAPAGPSAAGTELRFDAALIGYLPAPQAIARALGVPFDERQRAGWRRQLFAGAPGRWVERLETELGSSGFYCLPVFADEVGPENADRLVPRVLEAVDRVRSAGARAMALAGMLPASTGYGRLVARELPGGAPELTIGHAMTVVAMVRTLRAAARRMDLRWAGKELTVVGCGSIGAATLELALALGMTPKRVLLCDLRRARAAIDALGERLRARGFGGPIEVALGSSSSLPDAVYRADVVVGASSTPGLLDLGRLRSGALVVDDSFPHLFDPAHPRARSGELLVTGGGLMACRRMERTLLLSDLPTPIAEAIGRSVPRFGIASCQLEPLVRIARPELPAIVGPVTLTDARAYWEAANELGIEAAPLHIGSQRVQRSSGRG